MPRLSVFAACEKVILDKQDMASLITLFNQVTAQIFPNEPEPPRNAVIPWRWCLFTSWEALPEDAGKEYVECVDIFYPNGDQFGSTVSATFKAGAERIFHQVVMQAPGFPIGQVGPYSLKMRLEYQGETVFEAQPLIITVTHKKLDAIPQNVAPFGASA